MTSTHVLNEQKKRLEPIERKCSYCGVNNFDEMDDNYFVPLFKEKDRTNIIVYRSVKFSKILIGIPRCKMCLEIHQSAARVATYYAWGIGIAVLILTILMGGFWFFGGVLSCIFIGVFTPILIKNKIATKKGILTELEGAKQNELVQDFVINGWSFTQPSA